MPLTAGVASRSSAGPLWTPSSERIARANLTAFVRSVEEAGGIRIASYEDLHKFSVDEPEQFWSSVWNFANVVGDRGSDRVIVDRHLMPGARFFPDARLNFTENLLRRHDETEAIVFWGEDRVRQTMTWRDLHDEVSRFTQALIELGVGPGDRVAGYVANVPEAVIAALATAALGAIWSSCSPDFGVAGALDRFRQIDPKVLIAVDGYVYGGQVYSTGERLAGIVDGVPSVRQLVVIPYVKDEAALRATTAVAWPAVMASHRPRAIPFARLPFDHPLYILYSSGTTGPPKCIVHGAGGTLLQHLKEHQLHCDIHPSDRVFYFTTCGWMMWNWLVSVLASEGTVLLYDGSPLHPTPGVLFDFADAAGMTLFGTSARYLDTLRKQGLVPRHTHVLDTVRTMTSTGSPLAPENFDYVYERVKPDLHLASISGGTDIIACFVGGSPVSPVYRGEIQVAALGMKVEVFDEEGRPVTGQKGELVCTAPFPSLPLGFWNDPDGHKYRSAYFERYPGVWWHGDFVERTEHGGFIIHGRSDATLNPGGVRIGTAEIYQQVLRFDEVVEAVAVGQRRDHDERVVLFVRLREGLRLEADLVARIREAIRRHLSPRHVPARIVQVADIPRTKNGKIVELAVRDVIHRRPVKNLEGLANPEALDLFQDLPDLAD